MQAWGAAFYVQDSAARRDILQTWKLYASSGRLQKFDQVKSLVLGDKPPPLKLEDGPWTFETCAFFNKHFSAFATQYAKAQ